jgi:cold shock CspA family protein
LKAAVMYFKLTRERPFQSLTSDDRVRWAAVSAAYLQKEIGGSWNWVKDAQTSAMKQTELTMGLDRGLQVDADPRPVALRTVAYRLEDLRSDEAIIHRRRVLTSQLVMLNRLQSSLLPEPLDWLEIENPVDAFASSVSRRVKRSEPVLVLDWQRGVSIQLMLKRAATADAKSWGVRRIARIGRRILRWLCYLEENGVVWFNLHPSHILLLQNDVPRFVGLSGLCPILGDKTIDVNHPGFLRTIKGYCPPEFNVDEAGVENARTSSTLKTGAFALGVLILQLIALAPTLPSQWLSRGSFDSTSNEWRQVLPEYRRGEITALILALCNPDPNARLIDTKEILDRLDVLAGEPMRYKGTIRTWQSSKTASHFFGFIEQNGRGDDVYFHESALPNDLRRMLTLAGTPVSFEIEERTDERGSTSKAVRIRPEALT